MTVEALSHAASIDADRIEALEAGTSWADRRGELERISASLNLTVPDLVGFPIEPIDGQHAAIHAAAFHLRRVLLGDRTSRRLPGDRRTPEALAARASGLPDVEAAGDDATLAAALPDLVAALDLVVDGSSDALNHARITVRALASGLLRRLGWLDLAWITLEGLRPGNPEAWSRRRLAQARLLADLGAYPLALVHAQAVVATVPREDDGPLVVADIQARAGRVDDAVATLDRAARAAGDEAAQARVSAARLRVAVEAGRRHDEATERLAAGVDFDLLPGADHAATSIAAASVHAAGGDTRAATAGLLRGERAAPWRVRLDPLARDLVTTMAWRWPNDDVIGLAQRSGLL